MTREERAALEEEMLALKDFLEHPENWGRIRSDDGKVAYRYLGPPGEFTHNRN